ncbi:MAG TPA: DUF2167 domain-containing protein [Hyphomonas sp.]|nr:DUF2167 domain-containing protein [Hyphomonas sp.]
MSDMTAEEARAAFEAYAADTLRDVAPEHGAITLGRVPVVLSVPDSVDYYDGKESRTILEDLWGNPPDDTVLGMFFPAGDSPAVADWGAVITYEDTGYVSDDDAANMDYDKLLKDMQKSVRQTNPELERQGYPTVDLVGWAEPPHYDASNHRLEWAKDLIFSDSGGQHTLNYDMRVLGRGGVLSVNFIAPVDALDAIRTTAPDILAIPEFIEGNRYADYRQGDKTAGYGVAALIAGGVGVAAAKKAGLLTVGILFLKKGWVLVLAAFGAVGGWFKRLFGSSEKS